MAHARSHVLAAFNAHGYGRQTVDVDLVIRLDPATIDDAFRALESLGYRPRVPVPAADLTELALKHGETDA